MLFPATLTVTVDSNVPNAFRNRQPLAAN